MPTDSPSLAELVADAKSMAAALLPRPRVHTPRVLDLTKTDTIRIPESTISLVDDLEPYGS
jgi:hypothetical protein